MTVAAEQTHRRLVVFLAGQDPVYRDATVVGWRQLRGGQSSAMTHCSLRRADGVVEELVLRTDADAGHAVSSGGDRAQEWQLVCAVETAGEVSMPTPRFFDALGSIRDSPTLIFDYVAGEPLLRAARAGDADERRRLAGQVAKLAASLGHVDVSELPAHLSLPDSPAAYLSGTLARLAAVQRTAVEPDPFVRRALAFLSTHRPAPAPLTLVHGDFHVGNIMVTPAGTGVLVDWGARARIGDPREDFGHFVFVASGMPPDLVTEHREYVLSEYRESTGLSEQIVNPWSLTYFTLLAGVAVAAEMVQRGARLVHDGTAGTHAAYGALVRIMQHQQGERALRELAP
ncbi:MAG: phosphotransferase family protein [Actinomycetota bacterium]|nr:MAG: phosphotransferase family protein [Actinomycetota bacterium]